MTPILSLMVKMKMLDKAELVPRDILSIWFIHDNPGTNGTDLFRKLGYPTRSAVQSSVNRIVREGYVDDRRVRVAKMIPNILHLTPKGLKFYQEFIE